MGRAVTLPAEALAHKEINKKVDEQMGVWDDPKDKSSINELVKNVWKS